jgi:hypothetical protein
LTGPSPTKECLVLADGKFVGSAPYNRRLSLTIHDIVESGNILEHTRRAAANGESPTKKPREG